MLRSTKGVQVARISRIAVVLLVGASCSGCATLMQPLFAGEPTTAGVEPGSNFSAASSESSAATSVDDQWITHVYHGWAGPSSEM
jgi:ABC-type Fe3+-siderophore transport system permease subunit